MRYNIVAWILLILSVFSFVLAAPVPVREVCADAAEGLGGENVIIVSEKRAARGTDSDSDSDTEWEPAYKSTSYRYVDGGNTGVDTPSSSLSGSVPPPRSGETEVPLDPEGAFNPGTTTGNQPASSSNPKKVHWGPTTKVHFYEPNPSPSVTWGPTTKVHFYDPADPPDVTAAQKSPSPDIEVGSPSSHFEPPPLPEDINAKVFDIFDKIQFGTKFRRTSGTVSDTVDAA
ncbi:hypothetical protein F5888DRAFT_1138731 [Russula emetica]|nr:hypothetical protein F5888DRAFT_1138731 [Russula emetica]